MDGLVGQRVRRQQKRLHADGPDVLILTGVGPGGDNAGAVGRVGRQQPRTDTPVDGEQTDGAGLGQLLQRVGVQTGGDEHRVDRAVGQPGGSVGVVQVYSVYQAVVQAAGGQHLPGVLLGAGFLLADAERAALQLLQRRNAGVGPDNDLHGLLIQGGHGAEAALGTLVGKDAAAVVGILRHVGLGNGQL